MDEKSSGAYEGDTPRTWRDANPNGRRVAAGMTHSIWTSTTKPKLKGINRSRTNKMN